MPVQSTEALPVAFSIRATAEHAGLNPSRRARAQDFSTELEGPGTLPLMTMIWALPVAGK